MKKDLWEVLEHIGELTIKLEGVAATAYTLEEHMHDKNYSPTINLLGLVVEEAHELNKSSKLEKVE